MISAAAFVLRMLAGALLIGFVFAVAALGWTVWDLRQIDWQALDVGPSERAVVLLAADGTEIGWDGPRRAKPIPRDAIPPELARAVVAIEDRRFYLHPGIDPVGIARAAWRNWRSGRIVEGASTLTQQFARSKYISNERSYRRKIREMGLALWIDWKWEKNEILAGYLNNVYFGSGAYGAAAAADLYFQKEPHELSLAEAAILAGLVRAPSAANPLSDPRAASSRAGVVLQAMLETGAATPQEVEQARGELSRFSVPDRYPEARTANWFGDWAHRQLTEMASGVVSSDVDVLTATTTLDPRLQSLAEETLREAIAKRGQRNGATQGAMVAMRPDGAVLALVGGIDYGASRFNRATQAKRQPGSLFKLFVYYAALKHGWAPEYTIMDEPIEIDGWEPQNFGGEHVGEITLAEAFARSRNVPAVKLALDVGLEEVEQAARELGIVSPLAAAPSLALGASEVTLLEITGAYASVRAGRRVTPYAIASMRFGDFDQVLSLATGASDSTVRPYQRDLVRLLQGVVEHGSGRRAALDGVLAAGKTGTSQDHRDGWFVGFTDDIVVGVWIGNDDNSPMDGVTGGQLPAEIWRNFVSKAQHFEPEKARSVTPTAQLWPKGADDEVELAFASGEEHKLCDIDACSARYRSFRPSDCTYQPYEGPRRMCAIGGEGVDIEGEAVASVTVTGHTASSNGASCDIAACSARYRSFRSSDCTYQPYQGPRQACTAGDGAGVPVTVTEYRRGSNLTAYADPEPVRRVYRVPSPVFDRVIRRPHRVNPMHYAR